MVTPLTGNLTGNPHPPKKPALGLKNERVKLLAEAAAHLSL